MSQTPMHLTPIGRVRSPFANRKECPKQAGDNDPVSRIEIATEYLPAMHCLEVGQEIIVLTWLDRGDRTVLQCHPQGNPDRAMHGVFATRSPDRPNPIGHHRVTIREIRGNVLSVHPMEAMDTTPVLDIKPVLLPGRRPGTPSPAQKWIEAIIQTGRDGWRRGLFNGMNGNISVRTDEHMLITGTGSAKGHLTPKDLTLMDLGTHRVESGPPQSSETPVHLAVYASQPEARAIVHTHPPHLLALSLCRNNDNLLDLPLFEGKVFVQKMIPVPATMPGTEELAKAVGTASLTHPCIFMENHGLVVWADGLVTALALTEEIESLARIQLLGRTQ
ncbi:tRNA (N6-threonylcarbamoyladenosine(37)-N6)-methyltransferase TrmO [Desulfoplanes sp.]